MIYEKRDTDTPVKRDDMPIKEKRCESVMPIQSEGGKAACRDCRRRAGFPIKPHFSKRRRGRLAAVLILLVCFFAIDRGFFGSGMATCLSELMKDGARAALQSTVNEPIRGQSTLYTRLLSDAAINTSFSGETGEKVGDLYEQENDEALAVDNSISTGFVDGTRFYPITSLDLSADSLYSLNNGTSFSPDMQMLSETSPSALDGVGEQDGPLVLILHTHGEECYTEHVDMYPEGEPTRSNDTEKNVVRVGKEISDTLSDFGIETLHCRKMHDSESFINAYSGSAASVREYLEEYPSIKIVIDVHRDAIIRDDGESIKAAVEIAGEDYAQIMFVVGTNELGHNHPDWQDNLSLALSLQQSIDSTYPSLCRSINLRNVPFNQQLSGGYLLLEVGTSANTLDEALRSARAFGENLARLLLSSGE